MRTKRGNMTYHVREVVANAPQVRLQCSQEGLGYSGHVYE